MDIFSHFRQIITSSPHPWVFELGACDGYHSNIMVETIKQSDPPAFTFHCFEPRADLHPQIINNLHGHLMFNRGCIGIFPHAVGAASGKATFYSSSGERRNDRGEITEHYYGSSSLRRPTDLITRDWPGMQFSEMEVHVTSLDDHVRWMGRSYRPMVIDFIWADIQGAEVDMIAGAPQTLARTRYLYTEYYDTEYYEGQKGLDTILQLTGFEVVEKYGDDVLLKNPNIH